MANRVLLSAGELKVSKPGYDVLTTDPVNLSLDMNQMIGVYMTMIVTKTTGPLVPQTFTFPPLPYVPFVTIQLLKDGVHQGRPETMGGNDNGSVTFGSLTGAAVGQQFRIIIFYRRGDP